MINQAERNEAAGNGKAEDWTMHDEESRRDRRVEREVTEDWA